MSETAGRKTLGALELAIECGEHYDAKLGTEGLIAANEQLAQVRTLIEAARYLQREITANTGFAREDIREAIGNTNMAVLQTWIDEMADALAPFTERRVESERREK